MTSIIRTAAKQAVAATTVNTKVADLEKDTTDPSGNPTKGLTTDHGVFVADTDNWQVASLIAFFLYARAY